MSFTVVCPNCGARLTAPDTVAGKTVKCKKCDEQFVARPADGAGPDDERHGRAVPDEDAASRRRSATAGGEEGERSRRRPRADREDDRPPRPRRRDADDEEDDRPRGRRGEDGGPRARRRPGRGRRPRRRKPVLLFALIGAGALVLLCGGGVGVLWLAGAFGGGFTEYAAPDGTFTAKFPGTPARTVERPANPATGDVGDTHYRIQRWNTLYEVAVIGNPAGPNDPALAAGVGDVALALGVDQMLSKLGGTVTRRGPVQYQGRVGVEAELRRANGEVSVVRVFFPGRYILFAAVTGAGASPDPTKTQTFFESLKLLDPPRR